MVLARIEGDPKDVKGISIFIVPKYRLISGSSGNDLNDVYCPGIEHKMGINSFVTTQLSFGDNGACIGEILGAPRQGLKIMFNMMNEERLNVALQALGTASTAYLYALNMPGKDFRGRILHGKVHLQNSFRLLNTLM